MTLEIRVHLFCWRTIQTFSFYIFENYCTMFITSSPIYSVVFVLVCFGSYLIISVGDQIHFIKFIDKLFLFSLFQDVEEKVRDVGMSNAEDTKLQKKPTKKVVEEEEEEEDKREHVNIIFIGHVGKKCSLNVFHSDHY